MSWRPRSLQIRLSLLLLGLLLAMSGLYVGLLSQVANRYVAEDLQRRNRDLAASVASTLHLDERTNELPPGAVRRTFDAAMTVNPYIKLYFLNLRDGHIFNASAKPHEVKLTHVPLGPVRAFLAGEALPVFGADPRHPETPQPFSAVLLHTAAGQPYCYLYITLNGDLGSPTPTAARQSHILRVLVRTLAVAGVGVLLVGLLLISFLTRNLDRLSEAVRRLRGGDYAARVAVSRSGDDLSELALTFNDMAARTEQAVAALRNTDALRRELLANISHDLRTPLASIEGYTETILHQPQPLSGEEQQRYLGIILKNTQSLKRLVVELFELSKLEARHTVAHPEPLSLCELVQDLLLKLEPEAQARQLRLAAEWGAAAPNLPLVCADVGLLERALQNLLDNALHHTAVGGEVSVRLRPPTAHWPRVGIEVCDTGEGIASADLPFVFDRFFRAEQAYASKNPGLGLGLAIARRIAELHGSELAVRSTVGEGTCFSFSVPVYVAGASCATSEPGIPQP